jgi:trimethylamine--corrinoid protein Co-methyltransferase
MTYRLIKGIESREDFPALPLFEELLKEKHLLIADHTLRFLRSELTFPGSVIDRANRERWKKDGEMTLRERANLEVKRYLNSYKPTELSEEKKRDLITLMENEAKRNGQDKLPQRTA